MESFKLNLYQDEIYVLLRREISRFSRNATPVDFALKSTQTWIPLHRSESERTYSAAEYLASQRRSGGDHFIEESESKS